MSAHLIRRRCAPNRNVSRIVARNMFVPSLPSSRPVGGASAGSTNLPMSLRRFFLPLLLSCFAHVHYNDQTS